MKFSEIDIYESPKWAGGLKWDKLHTWRKAKEPNEPPSGMISFETLQEILIQYNLKHPDKQISIPDLLRIFQIAKRNPEAGDEELSSMPD